MAISAPKVEILRLQPPGIRVDLARFRGNVTRRRLSVAQAHAGTHAALLAVGRYAVGTDDNVG
jgi:hypothetical protein